MRTRSITGSVSTTIDTQWQVASCAAGAIDEPSKLDDARLEWIPARAPSTAASALATAKKWSLDDAPRRFDAEDWWWRARFDGSQFAGDGELVLCFDGIATLADVWLNGDLLLQSVNMFIAHRIDLRGAATFRHDGDNEIVIRCRSVDAELTKKRPRPKWRAPMIEHAQLRWIRTTLLGRTPGWTPACAPVGPWRPVRIERHNAIALDALTMRVQIIDGSKGMLGVEGRIRAIDAHHDKKKRSSAMLIAARDGHDHRAPIELREDGSFEGHLLIPEVAKWWPHTHGAPSLYSARIELSDSGPPISQSMRPSAPPPPASDAVVINLGNVGFRTIEAITSDDGFTLNVNGVRVFCRGACWMPLDAVSLTADKAAYEAAIDQVAAANMNMIRLSGTMTYEDTAFFDACDRAGILVWHDLMFANMDYPDDDPTFAASIEREAHEQLARLEGHPCIAVVCGNSEGEQQAAMFGASRDRWSPRLFHETLANLSRAHLPDVPYWPSSAHGGSFPHQNDRGTTSYYGVGAYERPLDDARRSNVRFASECLAFANIPAASTLARMPGGASLKVHHPGWKSRTPRDLGAGWDFDDTRDHYVARMFKVDPVALRYSDHARYVELGRVVTGEVMAQTFGEWRRSKSVCGGGLVWFLRDLWPGAGWGVIGSDGAPKAAWHYLRRALAPIALHVSDEGNNGLYVHIANDRPAPLEGELVVSLYRGDANVGTGRAPVKLDGRSALEVPMLSLFEGFMDLNHAYRFGPPTCDLVVVRLGELEAFHFPLGLPSHRLPDLGLSTSLARIDGGSEDLTLTVTTRSFAQSIAIDLEGYAPDDEYFHLAPGATKTIVLRRRVATTKAAARGTIAPLNGDALGITVPAAVSA